MSDHFRYYPLADLLQADLGVVGTSLNEKVYGHKKVNISPFDEALWLDLRIVDSMDRGSAVYALIHVHGNVGLLVMTDNRSELIQVAVIDLAVWDIKPESLRVDYEQGTLFSKGWTRKRMYELMEERGIKDLFLFKANSTNPERGEWFRLEDPVAFLRDFLQERNDFPARPAQAIYNGLLKFNGEVHAVAGT